jgi:DNA polymerase-3 subunit alpha
MIPFLKSEFSVGKSLIQGSRIKADTPNTPDQPDNIEDIIQEYKWPKTYLLEDNLGGFIPCYQKLLAAGSDMIFGYRVTVVEDAARLEDQPGSKVGIFVKSEAGWKTLVKLATLAQVDFYHGEARLDWKTIKSLWNDQLVLVSCFYDGFIHKNLLTKQTTIPDFGNIRPYMLLENNDLIFDLALREKVVEYAAAYGYETIEVKSCYYKNRADLTYMQARKLMDRKTFGGGNIEEPNIEFFYSAEFCIEAAMEHEWNGGNFEKEFEQPLRLFLPGVRLPEFKLDPEDKEFYKIPDGATDKEILLILAREGYKNKLEKGEISKEKSNEYGARVKKEIQILEDTSFVPYILLVWSVMRYARRNNFAHGFGRGSSAGSLVNWLVGITDIDPLPSDLYFERFISTTRAKATVIDGVTYITGALMDIDLDFGAEARDKIVAYLSEKYNGRFAKLATYNTKTTKALLKDAGKVLGRMSEDEIKFYSDEVPVKFGKVAKPEKAYEESEKIKQFADKNPIIFGCVKKLQGLISNFGSHASAYVISFDPLEDFMPIQYGTDNEIITSCDAHVTESMIIKLDLLGLQSVTLLDNVVKSLNIDTSKIDYESWDKIYIYLQNLKTPSNLFQISGSAAVRGLNKIKPRDSAALSDVLAICRPGSFVFIDPYSEFYNGRAEKISLHPLFDDILAKSGGVLLYQETLMQLFRILGFSLAEADDIRRIVGKKKTDEIAAWEDKIYKKAEENNIDRRAAEVLWSLALASSDYSFCKGHSVAYSKLSALSVYCKFNHSANFFLEAFKMAQNKQDPSGEIQELVQELPAFGIKLLPPSLTKSHRDFKLEDGNIRFGLEAIKGISEKSIVHLQSFIQTETANLFEVFQAAIQSKLNVTVVSSLLEVGCVDELSPITKSEKTGEYLIDRQKAVLFLKIWKEMNVKEQSYCLSHGKDYNFDLDKILKDYLNWVGPNGKPIGKESRKATLDKNCANYHAIYDENKKNPMISQWLFEKKLLGYCPSITLSELFDEYENLSKIEQVKTELYDKERLEVVGEIKEVKVAVSRKTNQKYCRLSISDETGNIDVLFTGDNWTNYFNRFGEPEEGQLIYIKGSRGGNEDPIVFGSTGEPQHLRIFQRVSDLNKYQEKEQKALGKSQNIEGAALN